MLLNYLGSIVHGNLAKVEVEGSNPFARSNRSQIPRTINHSTNIRILSLSERESAWRVLQKESERRKPLIEFRLNESDLNLFLLKSFNLNI